MRIHPVIYSNLHTAPFRQTSRFFHSTMSTYTPRNFLSTVILVILLSGSSLANENIPVASSIIDNHHTNPFREDANLTTLPVVDARLLPLTIRAQVKYPPKRFAPSSALIFGHSRRTILDIWPKLHINLNCEDINSASLSDLQRVKGIGRAKAQTIISYRDQYGPFQSIDELANVRGIGVATVQNFRKAGFCVKDEETDKPQNEQPNVPTKNSVKSCKDVNTADAEDLQRIKTIGTVKALAVIDYRNENGPFQSLSELTNVKGIGQATLTNFREAGFCVRDQTTTDENSESPTEISTNSLPFNDQNCNNINTANASDLQRVRGIGSAKALAIIEYRSQHGPFQSLDHLVRVSGIGPTVLENFRRANYCVLASNINADGHLYAKSFDSPPSARANSLDTANLEDGYGDGLVKTNAMIDDPDQFGEYSSVERLLEAQGISKDSLYDFQELELYATIGSASQDSIDLLLTPSDTLLVQTLPLPYHRSLYGGWLDIDNDCQNTRHEILIAESLVDVSLDESGCYVIGGQWHDPYLDTLITDPSSIDIDHFIPLAEAHQSGSAKWNKNVRYSFGNDLSENGELIPVFASVNRSKGSRDPANWLPPNSRYHCEYIERWVSLKDTWRLTMDYTEQKTINEIRGNCTLETEVQ